MKYSTVAAALLVAGASAQSATDLLKFPCASDCLTGNISKTGCVNPLDLSCSCASEPFISAVLECTASCPEEVIEEFTGATVAACQAAGVDISGFLPQEPAPEEPTEEEPAPEEPTDEEPAEEEPAEGPVTVTVTVTETNCAAEPTDFPSDTPVTEVPGEPTAPAPVPVPTGGGNPGTNVTEPSYVTPPPPVETIGDNGSGKLAVSGFLAAAAGLLVAFM